jgi:hypothetical protein
MNSPEGAVMNRWPAMGTEKAGGLFYCRNPSSGPCASVHEVSALIDASGPLSTLYPF